MAQIRMLFSPLPKVQVVTAGTPVPLSATPTKTLGVIIQADPANNGNIFIGGATVTAGRCLLLEPGRSLDIVPEDSVADEDAVFVDLNTIFVGAARSGDGVFVAVIETEHVSY